MSAARPTGSCAQPRASRRQPLRCGKWRPYRQGLACTHTRAADAAPRAGIRRCRGQSWRATPLASQWACLLRELATMAAFYREEFGR
eukprot:scaffold129055_cov51-Phaeocystis_antarctica.AAC.1